MAAGLAAGIGSLGGSVWTSVATTAEETGTEDTELSNVDETSTQDESTSLLKG